MQHKGTQITILSLCALALLIVRLSTPPRDSHPDPYDRRPIEISKLGNGKKPPNVVLIVIDTLRRDHLGCYGYGRDTSPRIDQFARDAIRCDDMIAASSWTIPSMMSIFTGLPPSLHQATFGSTFGAGITTLAESLSGCGYQTTGIAANPFAKSINGFAIGFDSYIDYSGVVAEISKTGAAPPPWAVRTSDAVTRLASQWLERRDANAPFFLYAFYFDPHADYVPPPPYDTMFDRDYAGSVKGNIMSLPNQTLADRDKEHVRALYDGEIRSTDEQVGALIAKIDALGLSRDTIVIITSDHGEELWDHGGTLHGHTLYDELVRVPFIIRWPGHLDGGKSISGQVSNMSVMPTLLDAIGVQVPTQCQAPSVLECLQGKPLPAQRVFSETDYQGLDLTSVRTLTQKIVINREKGDRRVFDLAADPGEQHDLSSSHPPWADELYASYEAWTKTNTEIRSAMSPARAIDRDEEMLKQLGYGQ